MSHSLAEHIVILPSLKGAGDAGQLVIAYRDAAKTQAALRWICDTAEII
jgi:hypothetical protein